MSEPSKTFTTLEGLAKAHNDLIAQYGWTAHYIVDARIPTGHTHGLQENFGHPDLQIVLPVQMEQLQEFLTVLAEAVVNGRIFDTLASHTKVFSVPIRFIERAEGNRYVLRALFPDPRGRWPEDPEVLPGYKAQLEP